MQARSEHGRMFAMGLAAMERSELQAAEQIFRGILQEDPRAHPAWNALVIVALQGGAAQTAVEYALRAVELDRRNALYLSNLGMAYGAAGQLAEAGGEHLHQDGGNIDEDALGHADANGIGILGALRGRGSKHATVHAGGTSRSVGRPPRATAQPASSPGIISLLFNDRVGPKHAFA